MKAEQNKEDNFSDIYGNAAEKLDVHYSYTTARKLEAFRSDRILGYKTAGSEAEKNAGDFLCEEMRRIGLITEKHAVTVDGWEFKGATLTYMNRDGKKTVRLGGYQTHFRADSLQTELVYAGKGTEKDFAGLDVKGKIALIRINQRDEWWINYPAYQAHLAGAIAVIAVQDKGYGEVDPKALNAQDICGIPEAAAFSMSKADMTDILGAMKNGRISVTVTADSQVRKNVTAYNITGILPGKTSQMIAVSAHYDSYFCGFEDDNTGVSMMLSLARALVRSGYTPEKTLVFVAFAAEEWGRTDSRYDWSAGAWAEMSQNVNDWRGRMIVDINLELPAIAHGKKHCIRSVYEYKNFLRGILRQPFCADENYPDGADVVCPVQTWSDDFSMAVSGVPSLVNDFTSGSFMETHYHSQFDDDRFYNEKIYMFHHRLYLGLLLSFDRCVLPPLDFSSRIYKMLRSVRKDMCDEKVYGNFLRAAETAAQTAEELYTAISEINASSLPEERAGAAAAVLLDAFMFCEKNFVALDWYEKSVFPHETAQKNIEYMTKALAALRDKDADGAKNALIEVDDNSYAEAFDRTVTARFSAKALTDTGSWGSGRITGHIDLFDVIRSLLAKRKDPDACFTAETYRLVAETESERKNLGRLIESETDRLNALNAKLKNAIITVGSLNSWK